MFAPPNEAVLAEIDKALDANTGQIGEVFRLLKAGAQNNKEIVELGGAANEGAVWSIRRSLTAIREASLPKAPSVARQCASRTRSLLRTPSLSTEAVQYLNGLIEALDALTFDEVAQAQEVADLEDKSQKLAPRKLGGSGHPQKMAVGSDSISWSISSMVPGVTSS